MSMGWAMLCATLLLLLSLGLRAAEQQWLQPNLSLGSSEQRIALGKSLNAQIALETPDVRLLSVAGQAGVWMLRGALEGGVAILLAMIIFHLLRRAVIGGSPRAQAGTVGQQTRLGLLLLALIAVLLLIPFGIAFAGDGRISRAEWNLIGQQLLIAFCLGCALGLTIWYLMRRKAADVTAVDRAAAAALGRVLAEQSPRQRLRRPIVLRHQQPGLPSKRLLIEVDEQRRVIVAAASERDQAAALPIEVQLTTRSSVADRPQNASGKISYDAVVGPAASANYQLTVSITPLDYLVFVRAVRQA
jgi:hypothetical protein